MVTRQAETPRAGSSAASDGFKGQQLGRQLGVRRLAAPGAGTGELEQRGEELRALDGARVDLHPVRFRQTEEKLPIGALGREPGRQRV